MRYAIALLFLAALLQACITPGGDSAGEAVAPVEPAYVPRPGLSDKERFREVLILLEAGDAAAARAELEVYMQSQPDSEVAQDLRSQIDTPATVYFPAEYREIQLQSGQSLSTVAKNYLGSVFKFHALAKYNGIAEPSKLTAGQTVRVPLTDAARIAFDESVSPEDSAPADMGAATEEEAVQVEQPIVTEVPEPVVAEDEEPVELELDEAAPAVEIVDSAPEAESVAPSPAVEELHRAALNAYRAQQLDEAIALWDEVLEIDPEHENARLYRAQAVELRKKLSSLF